MLKFSAVIYKKLFYIYISCIIILLVLPINGTIDLTKVYFGLRSDHIVHSLIFLPFMFLCFLGKIATTLGKLLVVSLFFAAFCESLHLFIPYRNASIFDFIANCIGMTFSFLLFTLAQRMRLIPSFKS